MKPRALRQLGGRYRTAAELRKAGFRHVGKDVKVHTRASLYGLENISLGDGCRIDDFTIIIATGPVSFGAHVSIPNFCFVGGKYGVHLDDFVTLAPGVKLFSASDDYHGSFLTGPTVPPELTGGRKGPVILRRHVLVGAGSVVLPGCTIGEGTAIGALSLVRDDLPAWGIYAGVPCRRVNRRSRTLTALVQHIKTASAARKHSS